MNPPRPLVAVYPGSFDHITLVHEVVALRTIRIADRMVIGVAYTSTQS